MQSLVDDKMMREINKDLEKSVSYMKGHPERAENPRGRRSINLIENVQWLIENNVLKAEVI